jgi:hypothetical protein
MLIPLSAASNRPGIRSREPGWRLLRSRISRDVPGQSEDALQRIDRESVREYGRGKYHPGGGGDREALPHEMSVQKSSRRRQVKSDVQNAGKPRAERVA